MLKTHWTRWFSDVGIDDVPFVGGKNASLGEMTRELGPIGVRVPEGYAVTADAYRHFWRRTASWIRSASSLTASSAATWRTSGAGAG